MKQWLFRATMALLGFGLFFAGRWDDEGMWLLNSIAKLPLAPMTQHGLELTPEQIYSATKPSLKDAIILLGGGTGSFISADGLIITNHHVAFAGLQALSSLQENYLANGFNAQTREEELPTSYTAQIVREMRDVSAEVLGAVNDSMSAEQRERAVRVKSLEIESGARASTGLTARVVEMYSGGQYYLFTFEALSDVRMVYAPPSAIGNYGGEVDNWIWPRHTGDFALMRAYVGPDGKPAKYAKANVPYHPKVFLPVSTGGVSEGSFAMILGFPGRTFRYREASGVELLRNDVLPTTIDLYKTRMDIIYDWGKKDPAIELKYANRVRGLANTYKNYLGVLQGMRRADLLAMKQKEEADFTAYANASPALRAKYGSVLADLAKANEESRSYTRKSLLFMSLTTGVDGFRLANRFRQYAALASPAGRDSGAVAELIATVFKTYDANVDRETLTALILKGAAMPAGQQPAAFQEIYGSRTGEERAKAVREFVDDLYESSDLVSPEKALKLLTKDPKKILKDDYVKLAASLEPEQLAVQQQTARLNPLFTQLRGKLIEGLTGWKKGTLVYPDANRTIRFTYGQVKPFHPRDAVDYEDVTTLSGVMEKETGEDPFIVPPKLKELWQKRDFGRYMDPGLKDVPVDFIANLDITGGNSGSPVINGKGELIGCAFDGNWEAVVGDYLFQEPLNRTISVDARYVLFILDKFSNAQNILKELTIR
ncbi:MAG TPA: S46 family peptidase [Bacteroidota bacterium]